MRVKDVLSLLSDENIDYQFDGDIGTELNGYSSIYNYKPGTISWLRDTSTIYKKGFFMPDYFTCLITKTGADRIDIAKTQIYVEDPKDAFFDVLDYFWGKEVKNGVSSASIIEEGATIGTDVSIGPFTHISSQTIIGDRCRIGSNVTINGKVSIGNDCVIQSGAVIGEDGYGFIRQESAIKFVKHYGGVTLGKHVQIGSQTCVCRGAIDDTFIDEYTKVDNLCHIAHNVHIGKRCLVIAGTVIMGSVYIGDDCWVATSMIRDLKHVGDHSTIGMGAVVVKDVDNGTTVVGNPAKPYAKQ